MLELREKLKDKQSDYKRHDKKLKQATFHYKRTMHNIVREAAPVAKSQSSKLDKFLQELE